MLSAFSREETRQSSVALPFWFWAFLWLQAPPFSYPPQCLATCGTDGIHAVQSESNISAPHSLEAGSGKFAAGTEMSDC
jgi:hypothetical protein